MLFVHYCNMMVCVVYYVGKWQEEVQAYLVTTVYIKPIPNNQYQATASGVFRECCEKCKGKCDKNGGITQGSTLTVVRLGIPSSFCCRTTWTYVYGCPLVKLRKLIKWIILDRPFISGAIESTWPAVHSFLQFLFVSLFSQENKEWFTSYTRPFHGWFVTHSQPGRCSLGGWWRCHANSHNVVRWAAWNEWDTLHLRYESDY